MMSNEAMAKPVGMVGTRLMRVAIKGRCDRVRKHEGVFYTTVTTPAADEYSRPNVLELRSKGRFVEPGDTLTVEATLGGYGRAPYQFTDKETGERRTVHPVVMTLDLVE